MSEQFSIRVFGKPGCPKCTVLNQRLDRMLKKQDWQDFSKEYCDVTTEDGLIAFSEAECVNPQRLPALLVMTGDEKPGDRKPLPNPAMGQSDDVCKNSRLYTYLGLQTDYSSSGRGVISPRMIETVLTTARG